MQAEISDKFTNDHLQLLQELGIVNNTGNPALTQLRYADTSFNARPFREGLIVSRMPGDMVFLTKTSLAQKLQSYFVLHPELSYMHPLTFSIPK